MVTGEGRLIGLELIDEVIDRPADDTAVVLMAGGVGTRLKPLTETTPKPLLPVGGRPLIENIILGFAAQGFRRFFLAVNYKAELFKDHFGDGSAFGVSIEYLEERERKGTAGALSLLPERPRGPFLVMNGDLLTTVNFRQLLDFHREHRALATMCVREHAFQVPYGVVEADDLRLKAADREADPDLPGQCRHLCARSGRARHDPAGSHVRHDRALRRHRRAWARGGRVSVARILAGHRTARRPRAGQHGISEGVRVSDTLVIGLGSIGERHARLLTQMGRAVATVSRRGGGDHVDLEKALARTSADYVVIANETSAHAATLAQLAAAGFRGRVLVEKPLFAAPAALPANGFRECFVGYNLRFHPALLRIRDLLAGRRALDASAYVGQYLPDWRPGRDHRTTASASAETGGGVLRDLSHELDYLLWLFGPWRRVAAITVRSGTLGIGVEDVATILMECERCAAVTVHLNYLHRPVARTLTVNASDHTYAADLVGGRTDGGWQGRAGIRVARDDTYLAMHAAVIAGAGRSCTAEEGLAVVDLIDAIERAASTGTWVGREG